MLEGAGLLASPFFKSLLACMGRKNAIIYGHLFMFIANTSLACIAFIPPEKSQLFFIFSLVIRFILGLGDALVLTTNNAVVCLAWGE